MASGGNPCGCPEGIATCEEVFNCMSTHICQDQGLWIDPTTDCIGLRVGTCLGFGPGGELVYTCGTEPQPGPCQRTWATVTEFFVGGRGGGAANLVGWASPQAIDYAISNNVEMIEAHSFQGVDNIAVWSPTDKDTALDYFTTNPITSNANSRFSNEWIALTSDPGNPANYAGRNARAPQAERDLGDGGYMGYNLPQFSLLLATDALHRIDGRALVNLDMSSGSSTTPEDVTAGIKAINRACAQEWAMITVTPEAMALVPSITAAGIQACVGINNKSGFTPAQVVASGAQWVRINGSQSLANTTAYVTAGLKVLVHTNSRQYETTRAMNLGAAGVICNDPVYASDDFPDYGYQSFGPRTTTMGILDYFSDQGDVVNSRGYTRNALPGFFLYNAPWISDDVTTPTDSFIQSELVGSIRPKTIPAPASYTIALDMRVNYSTVPSSSLNRIGIIFGAVQDTDQSGIASGAYGLRYQDIRTGYVAFMHISGGNAGRVAIGRFDALGYTQLGVTATNVAFPLNTWIQFLLTVTPSTIRWERVGGPNITVTDATYRGKHVHMMTWNSQANPATYETGWRNIDPTWPAPAGAAPFAAGPGVQLRESPGTYPTVPGGK